MIFVQWNLRIYAKPGKKNSAAEILEIQESRSMMMQVIPWDH
jgi:hypothetical protein